MTNNYKELQFKFTFLLLIIQMILNKMNYEI
jgi:hypothetical protein